MAVINSFLIAFTSGQLSPFTWHFVLLGGAIVAEILVAIGIWLESPRKKDFREWIGLAFVFGGVVISAIFTIALFIFDEGLSGAQQSKIIALETRLAPRRIVSDEQEEMAEPLKLFAGQKFEIFATPGDTEANRLAHDIDATLISAGWVGDPSGATMIGMGAGVSILNGNPDAADALARELNNVNIEARVIAPTAVDRVQIEVGPKP